MASPYTRRRRSLIAALAVAALATAVTGAPVAAAPAIGEIRHAGGPTVVPDSYIVVLKDSAAGGPAGTRPDTVDRTATKLTNRYGGKRGQVYGAALNGFEVRLPEQAAKRLAADPAVAYVEQNHVVTAQATPWGLDRIDQRNRPLDGRYDATSIGVAVRAYVVDTGIQATHPEFGGRVRSGYSAFGGSTDDCNGHGTHVASIVGGSIHGVAKGVQLVAVRVLDCAGTGTTAGVIAGVNWVTTHHVRPAVALLSLNTTASTSLDMAVANTISRGVTVVAAAGNSNANACNYSPSRVPTAITVGATTSTDARASYSNYGSCLNIFAPGSSIPGAWIAGQANTISGTSMAAAHVAGGAARVLSRYPSYTPAQVSTYLVNNATPNVISHPGTGSPNRLLYLDPML